MSHSELDPLLLARVERHGRRLVGDRLLARLVTRLELEDVRLVVVIGDMDAHADGVAVDGAVGADVVPRAARQVVILQLHVGHAHAARAEVELVRVVLTVDRAEADDLLAVVEPVRVVEVPAAVGHERIEHRDLAVTEHPGAVAGQRPEMADDGPARADVHRLRVTAEHGDRLQLAVAPECGARRVADVDDHAGDGLAVGRDVGARRRRTRSRAAS